MQPALASTVVAPRSRRVAPATVAYFAERYHRAFAEEGALLVELLEHPPEHRLALAPLLLCVRGLTDDLDVHGRRQEALLRHGDDAAFDADAADVAAAVDATRGVLALTRAALPTHRALFARLGHFLSEVERHLDEERAAVNGGAAAHR